MKTDVENVEQVSKGVFVISKPDPSEYQRQRAIHEDAERTKAKINSLEQQVSSMQNMLVEILKTVRKES